MKGVQPKSKSMDRDRPLQDQQKQGRSALERGAGPSHLADLLGEQQELCQPNAVPWQVVPKAAQGDVFHDQLYRLLSYQEQTRGAGR